MLESWVDVHPSVEVDTPPECGIAVSATSFFGNDFDARKRLADFCAAEIRCQNFWQMDAAIRLLVGLNQRDKKAG